MVIQVKTQIAVRVEVVRVKMVTSSLESSKKATDNSIAQVTLLDSTVDAFTGVDYLPVDVSSFCIAQCPDIESPLCWFVFIYCLNPMRPLNGTIASSMVTSGPMLYNG